MRVTFLYDTVVQDTFVPFTKLHVVVPAYDHSTNPDENTQVL